MRHDSAAPPAFATRSSRAPASPNVTVVDWIALTREPRVVRVLVAALAFVAAGVLLVLVSRAPEGVARAHPWLSVCGVLVIMAGAVWTLLNLVCPLHRDAYVAIRVDGLLVRSDDGVTDVRLPWECIDDVHAEGETVNVVHSDGEVLALEGPFDGVDANELVKRLRHARRLAVWGRLTATSLEPFRTQKA